MFQHPFLSPKEQFEQWTRIRMSGISHSNEYRLVQNPDPQPLVKPRMLQAVLGIRIRIFWGPQDPDPDPLVSGRAPPLANGPSAVSAAAPPAAPAGRRWLTHINICI